MKSITIGTFLLCCIGTGWAQDRLPIQGSGKSAQEVRHVERFGAVRFDTAGELDISIGPNTSVELTADDNILEHVTTKVTDGVLTIDTETDVMLRPQVKLRVKIQMPQLKRMTFSGAGDAVINDLNAESLDLHLDGAGSITATGRCQQVQIELSGTGELNLEGLQTQRADVTLNGSGDVKVQVEESLQALITGVGNVFYVGAPQVQGQVRGIGTIQKSKPSLD